MLKQVHIKMVALLALISSVLVLFYIEGHAKGYRSGYKAALIRSANTNQEALKNLKERLQNAS